MRKFLVKMFLAVGLLAASFAPGMYIINNSSPTPDRQVQVLQPSLQINKNCSATVVVSDKAVGTYLVTAQHCVEGKKDGVINYATDVLGNHTIVDITYSVVDEDKVNDLALIRTTTLGFKVAQVATEKPAEGQEVWTAGYPLGLPRMLSTGFYGLNMLVGPMDHQRASAFITSGNSGGGMFVIEDGVYKLVGVTSKGYLDPMRPAMFTPIGLYSELTPIRYIIDSNVYGWDE